MTEIHVWTHPRSLARGRGMDRLTALRPDAVRVAYVYHSARWLSHSSRPGMVDQLGSGGWSEAVAHQGLGLPIHGDDADQAAADLRARGVAVIAWIVGLHSTPLATRHPDLAVVNAFGHSFRHALCPAVAEVADHAIRLVAGVAATGVDGIDLEAFGYLGWPHTGEHSKFGNGLRPVDEWLLSVCLCVACEGRLDDVGVDADALRARIRTEITRQLEAPRPAAADTSTDAVAALGQPMHDRVLEMRSAVTEDLVVAAVAAAAGVPTTLRVTRDQYACGGKSTGDLARLATAAGTVTFTDLTADGSGLNADLTAAAAAGVPADRVDLGWLVPRARRVAMPDLALGPRAVSLYAYDQAPDTRLAEEMREARVRLGVAA